MDIILAHVRLFWQTSFGWVLIMASIQVIVVDNYFTGSKDNLKQWIGHPRFELIRHGRHLNSLLNIWDVTNDLSMSFFFSKCSISKSFWKYLLLCCSPQSLSEQHFICWLTWIIFRRDGAVISWSWSNLPSCLPCLPNFLQIQSCEGRCLLLYFCAVIIWISSNSFRKKMAFVDLARAMHNVWIFCNPLVMMLNRQ